VSTIPFTFQAVTEAAPGAKWQARFAHAWPAYRAWFLKEGDAARPSYVKSRLMLERHMPELVPTYERLLDLAGGGDLAARLLTLYDPPPYLSGCSQGVLVCEEPVLVRNYDYAPSRLEGVVVETAWTGRRVIGMSDCLWGLLDGMNDAGLAVSLTFGGRRVLGKGFGIPLVVRYLLETCATVGAAVDVLERLPFHLAHNLTLADASGAAVTALLAPDRRPVYDPCPVATNHQQTVEWPEHAEATRTLERAQLIAALRADPDVTTDRFVDAFRAAPLFSRAYSRGFGTLYTAVYRPASGQVDYLWPGGALHESFAAFHEGAHTEPLHDAA
jgi:predicted choloylglycine hydrolase